GAGKARHPVPRVAGRLVEGAGVIEHPQADEVAVAFDGKGGTRQIIEGGAGGIVDELVTCAVERGALGVVNGAAVLEIMVTRDGDRGIEIRNAGPRLMTPRPGELLVEVECALSQDGPPGLSGPRVDIERG